MSDIRPSTPGPEHVTGEALDKGEFPTEAWEFTEPSAATPTLTLKPGWTLDANIACPYPIGAVYWQLPNKAAPATLWPTSTWDNISSTFPGEFFRAEGGAASAFQAGEQADQMQGHKHNVNNVYMGIAGANFADSSVNAISAANTATTTPVTDGTNGTPRTGAETRPLNVTIRLWERTA